jgi:SAM-dependent methyltransferase
MGGPSSYRDEVMLAGAEAVHHDEITHPWDAYFGMDLRSVLPEGDALDLGCANGGRSLAWLERYRFRSISGVDVQAEYVEGALLFAQDQGVEADFRVAAAENLPYADASFDAILSYDVFEHVQDVRAALSECRRVLRQNGVLCLVFPSYFQPFEHHLGFVTRVPGVQLLFRGRTLIRAYTQITNERGDEAAWYARGKPEAWERGHTLNGITTRRFRNLMGSEWNVVAHPRPVLGSVGRQASRPAVRVAATMLRPFARLPVLEEVVVHRIIYVLRAA